tara:strand:+ start:150 stop:536 length:387 start_codon:yes stop_codon:yes gene_type:complete
MKALKLIPLFLIAFLFCNYTAVAQEEEDEDEIIEEIEVFEEATIEIIQGVYLGMEDGTYNFSYFNEDKEKDIISFDKMSVEALKMFDLKTKNAIGKKFEVTFSSENVADPDDMDMLTNMKTIISLKQL